MPCPGPYPQLAIPAKTPPPRAVLNSMAMAACSSINDAMQGLKPYVEGRALPKGVTQERVLVTTGAMVYASLTHKGATEAPICLGDVLRSKVSGAFFDRALDTMHAIRAAYLFDSAQVTSKMKKKDRKRVARMGHERDEQIRVSNLSDGQKAALQLAVSAGEPVKEALVKAEGE